MAWKKLENPKPTVGGVLPTMVRIKARELNVRGGGKTRYILIHIGSKLCDSARFRGKEHHCHVMTGSGADAGKLAIAMDDQSGKFTAKRKTDTSYQVTIKANAAAGNFSLAFPPFERLASVQNIPGAPPVITFDVTPDFLGV